MTVAVRANSTRALNDGHRGGVPVGGPSPQAHTPRRVVQIGSLAQAEARLIRVPTDGTAQAEATR
jgi:hypothetical protein